MKKFTNQNLKFHSQKRYLDKGIFGHSTSEMKQNNLPQIKLKNSKFVVEDNRVQESKQSQAR